MLLFRKPLSEIQIGESFQATVTPYTWERASATCAPGKSLGEYRCALAIALQDAGIDGSGSIFPEVAFTGGMRFSHNGADLVIAFDEDRPLLTPTVVTFTRES